MKVKITHRTALEREYGTVSSKAEHDSVIPTEEQIAIVNRTIVRSGGFRDGLTVDSLVQVLHDSKEDLGFPDKEEVEAFLADSIDAYMGGVPDHLTISSLEMDEDSMSINVRINPDES